MSGSWISTLKEAYDVPTMAQAIGLRTLRLGTITPCPGCGAEQRGSEDRRGPIGCGSDKRGWKCFRCQLTGDAIDLLALHKAGKRGRELSGAEWSAIKSFCVEHSLIQDDSDIPRVASVGATIRRAQPQPMATPVEEPAEGTGGPFAWREGRAEEAAARLFTDEGKVVRDYLASERGFTEATMREWSLGMERINGEPWLTIPLKDVHQRIINLRYRSVPPAKKTFRVCTGRPLPLYGVDRISGDSKDTIICVEGELDVVALWQYGVQTNVVSTTAGSDTFKDEWADALEPYASFVLAYDNDEAGNRGAAKLGKMLGEDRCARAVLPKKDVGECLSSGISAEAVKRALNNAQPMFGVGFRQAHEYAEELERLINSPDELVGRPTGSANLDACIGGLRPGLTVITGEAGSGKSTLATWLCWEQARRDVPTMVTSFENRPIGLVQKVLRMQLGGDFTKVSPDMRREALDELGRMPLYLMDHYGMLGPQKVIDAIKYAVRRHGVQTVLVDHLGFMLTGGADERQQTDNIIRQFAVAAYSMKVHIILIAHLRTLPSDAERPTMNDLKGASSIKQDASEVLIVVRENPNDKRKHPATWVYVDKNRSEFGAAGSKCLLAFGPMSLIYADQWEYVPESRAGIILATP